MPSAILFTNKVETVLSQLVSDGISSPVDFPSWEAPIVPVVKQDGSGDYKLTINQAAKTDSYLLP